MALVNNQNFLTLINKTPLRRGTHFRHAAAAFLVLLKKGPVTRERKRLLDVKAHTILFFLVTSQAQIQGLSTTKNAFIVMVHVYMP